MQSFISAVAVIDIPELSADDEAVVADYLKDILAEKSVRQRTNHSRNAKITPSHRKPDLSQLSDDQLNVLIASILEMKSQYEVRCPILP